MSRVLDRVGKFCEGCQVRLTIGVPSSNAFWDQQLLLSEHQIKLLTQAAREFDELVEEADTEPLTALEFIDWLSPSARGPYRSPPAFDGAPRHNLNGEPAVMQHKGDTHRHPFPLPVQSNGIRHTKGRRAG